MVNIALFTNTERTIKSFFYLESTEKQEQSVYMSVEIDKEIKKGQKTEKK